MSDSTIDILIDRIIKMGREAEAVQILYNRNIENLQDQIITENKKIRELDDRIEHILSNAEMEDNEFHTQKIKVKGIKIGLEEIKTKICKFLRRERSSGLKPTNIALLDDINGKLNSIIHILEDLC